MKSRLVSLTGILAVCIALGLLLLAQPETAYAQNQDREKKEKKQEIEDEDEDSDENLTAEDKQRVQLSIESARAVALERVPGTVIDEELEKERGRLQYAFDIRDANGKIFDVEVDAQTGKILQAIEEDEDDDEDDVKVTKKVVKKETVERTARVVKSKPR
jgi:uncharacterized membrane protein YkoI